jgi:peptidoglycan/xylan/chitin deacetylase (PgdA/CDA1 family)
MKKWTSLIITLFIASLVITIASTAILTANLPNSTPNPTQLPTPSPTKPPTMYKTVIITFDDGWISQLNAIPILDKYNYKATFGIITSYEVNNYSAYMNWSTIENLATQGHDIQSHTTTHVSLNSLTTAQLSYELKQSQQELQSHGINATILIYPYGDGYDNQTVRNAASLYYQYARDIQPGPIDLTAYDRYAISATEIEDEITLSEFADLLNTQQNGITIIFYHKISYDHDYSVTPENFAAQMQYLHDHNFTVLTMKQIFNATK